MKKIVTLGKLQDGTALRLDVLRMIHMSVMASSGGGKTYTLLELLQVTRGLMPQCVIDPEGDFTPLRRNKAYDYVLASPRGGDIVAHPSTAAVLARHFVERNFNLLIDLYEMDLPDQRRFVRLFFEGLLAAPRNLWRPRLIMVDECQEFAPEKGGDSAESLPAMIRMAKKGRKRGFKLVSATQRPADVSKALTSQLGNKLIGVAYTDVDQDRAAKELRIRDKAKADTLAKLEPGWFYAVGSALGHDLKLALIDVPKDRPDEGGKAALRKPPAPGPRLKAILAGLATLPKEALEEAKTTEELRAKVRTLEGEVRKAKAIVPPVAPNTVIQQVRPDPEKLKAMAERIAKNHIYQQVDLMAKRLKSFFKDLEALKVKLDRDIENMTEAKMKEVIPIEITIPQLTKEQREKLERTLSNTLHRQPLRTVNEIKKVTLEKISRFPAITESLAFPNLKGDEKLDLCARNILDFLVSRVPGPNGPRNPSSRIQIAVGAGNGYRMSTGGFRNAIGRLRTLQYIHGDRDAIVVGPTQPDPAVWSIGSNQTTPLEKWLQNSDKAVNEVYKVMYHERRPLTKEEIAGLCPTNYSPTSGGFRNAIGRLCSLGILERQGAHFNLGSEAR